MKLKKFDDYLKKRLDQEEINKIEDQVDIEIEALKALQQDISHLVKEYMVKKDIGFNELVRRLDVSPMQVAKIQKGEANLTLASVAHLAALLNQEPHIVFKDYIEVNETVEIRGYHIGIKYKKEETATMDRNEVKRLAAYGITQYIDKRGIDIAQVDTIKCTIEPEHPFYTMTIFRVKKSTGETCSEREIYHSAA